MVIITGTPAFLHSNNAVVDIDHIWLFAPQRVAHSLHSTGRIHSGEKAAYPSCHGLAHAFGGHPELRDVVADTLEYGIHLVHYGLFARTFPVVVVYQQYLHRRLQ